MKGLSGKRVEIPSMEEITQERKRLSYRRRYKRVLKSTAYALVVVAAIAVLLATNLLPVLQVSGDSMQKPIKPITPFASTPRQRISHRAVTRSSLRTRWKARTSAKPAWS